MHGVSILLKWIALLSAVTLAGSFFLKDVLPSSTEVLPDLEFAPVQQPTSQMAFEVQSGGITYTIRPLFDYDIRGLVVSDHDTGSWFDYYHKEWQDFLNVKDLCVVWGKNATSGIYDDFSFRSGSWTCYYQTDSSLAYSRFNHDELSNNHLLAATPAIAKKLAKIGEGDQVRIKGYLAEYSHAGGFSRGSSVVRTDTGNGACETIFVTSVEVLSVANPLWRSLYGISLYTLPGSLATLILLFFIHIYTAERRYRA